MKNDVPSAAVLPAAAVADYQNVGFAAAIITVVMILFLPLPAVLIDIGLALSIALSVLILMVSLWIQRPLEFSSFPTVLLVVTMLRLSLNIATTRVILSHGAQGDAAAGHVISGFANFVIGGDFVIGTIVFLILITVNFIVITKGASRIAEVAARFTLDSIPGKQLAIDADLSAGVIDDKEATLRRRELEEESAFFGAMDGASKFVRGDAVAGLIITGVNMVGGIIIGVVRHDMSVMKATEVFVKLSIGDGLVTQIPALIVSLAAGLLVSKGGIRGSTEAAVSGQLGKYPVAMGMSSGVILLLGMAPGLPFAPFALLAGALGTLAYIIPQRRAATAARRDAAERVRDQQLVEDQRDSVRESLRTFEIEVKLGKQLSAALLPEHAELTHRVTKMRRKFAQQYGFILPEIRVSDDIAIAPKRYQFLLHGTVIAASELRIGDVLVVTGQGNAPDIPCDETREPAFGMKAFWVNGAFTQTLKARGFQPIDPMSVLLTHLAETIRGNLAQLLSYKDMRSLTNRLEPEYRKLLDEIMPSQISASGLQAVLRMLIAERVSIRNLHLILEAIAEIVPHVRRTEQIVEHVRVRMAQQISGDLLENGALSVIRLGPRWDMMFQKALKRDQKGEIVEFDVDPRLIEEFGQETSLAVRPFIDAGRQFVIVSAPDARPYVRMVVDRMFPMVPVLSHLEIVRGIEIRVIGSISA
jgi:flagellar biosynthesis protein FlhA